MLLPLLIWRWLGPDVGTNWTPAALAQAPAPNDAVSVINSLGLPVGFLVLTIGALRVMWRVMSQRDHEALQRERESTKRAEDRADRLENALAALNEDVRDKIVPTLERATVVMAKELSRRDGTS